VPIKTAEIEPPNVPPLYDRADDDQRERLPTEDLERGLCELVDHSHGPSGSRIFMP
jgi:hypothetical protein